MKTFAQRTPPPLLALLIMLTALLSPEKSEARELTVDLSNPVVAITTGFTGTDLLLYGAVRDPGDVIVVVRGPAKDRTVRRKARVGGVWVNRDELTFKNVPAFYWLASNRPIGEIAPGELQDIHQIGLDNVLLRPATTPGEGLDPEEYRAGLIRNMQTDGLYAKEPGDVVFLSENLFRTKVYFPANVTVGTFGVDVFLVRDGQLAGFETTILTVRKFGLEAQIFNLAHEQSLIYGLLAVVIAVVAGWLGNAAFKKS